MTGATDTQFSLGRAYQSLRLALEQLTIEEEYLREALKEELYNLTILFDKICVEEALKRDRDALLSDPSEGLGEHLQDG
jgi:hypothetical protein